MYGNNPEPTYSAANNTESDAESYSDSKGPVGSAKETVADGCAELPEFPPGMEAWEAAVIDALGRMEDHGVSVGETMGDAADEGVSTDESNSSEYAGLSIPDIN